MQGLGEALEILGPHADDAPMRAINVGYEKERYGKSDRQNQKKEGASSMRTVTYQYVAENGDRDQK